MNKKLVKKPLVSDKNKISNHTAVGLDRLIRTDGDQTL